MPSAAISSRSESLESGENARVASAEAARRSTSGFAAIERHTLPHDPMNVWFVARRA